jgi:hypothetical protein
MVDFGIEAGQVRPALFSKLYPIEINQQRSSQRHAANLKFFDLAKTLRFTQVRRIS